MIFKRRYPCFVSNSDAKYFVVALSPSIGCIRFRLKSTFSFKLLIFPFLFRKYIHNFILHRNLYNYSVCVYESKYIIESRLLLNFCVKYNLTNTLYWFEWKRNRFYLVWAKTEKTIFGKTGRTLKIIIFISPTHFNKNHTLGNKHPLALITIA